MMSRKDFLERYPECRPVFELYDRLTAAGYPMYLSEELNGISEDGDRAGDGGDLPDREFDFLMMVQGVDVEGGEDEPVVAEAHFEPGGNFEMQVWSNSTNKRLYNPGVAEAYDFISGILDARE